MVKLDVKVNEKLFQKLHPEKSILVAVKSASEEAVASAFAYFEDSLQDHDFEDCMEVTVSSVDVKMGVK